MASNRPSSASRWGSCPFRSSASSSFSSSSSTRQSQHPPRQQQQSQHAQHQQLQHAQQQQQQQQQQTAVARNYAGHFMPRQQLQEKLPDGSARFKLCKYASEMLESLHAIRQEDCLCDVTLHTADTAADGIKAHKVVLAGSSEYFRGMFTRGMREVTMSEVCIREGNITREALCQLVDFAYTGEIHITQDNVQRLLVAALFLQMRHVIEACTVYLEQQLDQSNCLGIMEFARAHDCMELEAKARRFVHQHFCDVSKNEEILDLSAEDMAEIVQREDLNIK
ncbi:kelch-like ech-associated protein [Elysia marginata]|uniref:Kelch-like ech-associated protein n=1 Tax=Elysia marginata TaxID=1093978 RepID=A0AAV4FXQ7_9GAST|nr:kelch-like ech-associated protein [Elysia marginata]